jgi:exocyst complex component 2
MDERTLLDFYHLPTLNPTEWPAENNSDDSQDEDGAKEKIRRRKSRYQALERAVTNRKSVIPGSEKAGRALGGLVQKDEPDPLGTTDSVVRSLKQLGLPVQDNAAIRRRSVAAWT